MRACTLLLLFAAGCSRCGGKSAASAEELLPRNPAGAVVTAPLGAVAQHLAALGDRLQSLPGGEQLGDSRRSVATQLGFDPLTREGLLSAGLDPDRGAAVAVFELGPAADWAVALPLTRPDEFAKTMQRLLVTRFGASPGQQPQTFERNGFTLAWKVVRGYGMLARGPSPMAHLEPPAKEESLARAAGLDAARKQLGAQDFVVWAPAGSALPRRYTSRPLPGDVALAVAGSQDGLASRFNFQLPQPDAERARQALPGGGASLVDLLPPDAPLRARFGIASPRLLEWLRGNPDLRQLLDRLHGADAEAFSSLQPGAAVSLALARDANIGAALDYGFDWRRKSPFDTVQLVALAQVADRPRLLRALEQIARDLPALGARVERQGDDFQISYAAGRGARFGVREIEGKPIAYVLGGPLRPDELRAAARSKDPEAAPLYQEGGAAVRIDFGRLAASLRDLPESTYGTGPQAYVARSLVSQVIEPLRTLRLSIAAEAFADRLGASVDLQLVPP